MPGTGRTIVIVLRCTLAGQCAGMGWNMVGLRSIAAPEPIGKSSCLCIINEVGLRDSAPAGRSLPPGLNPICPPPATPNQYSESAHTYAKWNLTLAVSLRIPPKSARIGADPYTQAELSVSIMRRGVTILRLILHVTPKRRENRPAPHPRDELAASILCRAVNSIRFCTILSLLCRNARSHFRPDGKTGTCIIADPRSV